MPVSAKFILKVIFIDDLIKLISASFTVVRIFRSDLRSRIALNFFLGMPLVVIPRDLMLVLEIVRLNSVSLCLKGFIRKDLGADPLVVLLSLLAL